MPFQYLWCILFTIFSLTHFRQIQGDIIIITIIIIIIIIGIQLTESPSLQNN